MNKIKLKPILMALTLLFTSAMSCGAAVFAEDSMSESTMTVSPMTQKIVLIPGETTEVSIKVSNPYQAKQDLEYSASVGAFSQTASDDGKDDYGKVDTGTITSYNQIVDWITLGKESGSVAPNEVDIIPVTIKVPVDAPAGGQYATILVTDDTEYMDSSDGNVAIQSRMQIASIIYAEVAGETKEMGSILENNTPSFLLSNTLETTSMVRNDGNVHTDASYVLQVWPLFSDEEICTNEESPETSLVLPGTERYHMQSCELPAIGFYKVKQTVKIFGEESIIEKTIFYCPIWLLFIIFFVIAALIIWIIMRVRHHNKRSATA